ncbi:MAG TPA: hypothetical protein VGN16_09280 [Acidobacteriaceae bacterium]
MSLRYIHFSARPLERVHTVEQAPPGTGGSFLKPLGLWFSVEGNDDGWKSWCEAEMFRTDKLAFQTEIVFRETARILKIETPESIDDFTQNYQPKQRAIPQLRGGFEMDWHRVAREYDAMVISPYQWERRMGEHTMWYYSWDCASGCVWNADAIKELVPVAGVPA